MLVVAIAACSESSRRSPTTPSTTPLFTTRLELSGPGTVHLEKTGQFTATAFQSDGSTRDVTAEANWFSVRTDILSAGSKGVFTGRSSGETTISASLFGKNATSTVIVVPEGTFRLSGAVRDSGVPVDALVRVESAATGRLETMTNAGQYRVYGVTGDTEITAIKDGYEARTTDVIVTDHRQVDIDLVPSRSRPDVSGIYRLTVKASPNCAALPDDARERSYDAEVQQAGPALTVTLTGSEFAVDRGRSLNTFTGVAEPTRAVFRILGPTDFYYYYYYYSVPDVNEVLSPGRFYGFDGTVTASISNSRISGTLNGWIRVRSSLRNAAVGRCQSADHTFVLSR